MGDTRLVAFVFLSICSVGLCENRVIVPDDSVVHRPCGCDDLQCLQQVFADRGWCPDQSPDEDPASLESVQYIDDIPIQGSFFNASGIYKDVAVTGLQSGVILDFYINNKTETAVLLVNFKNVQIRGKVFGTLFRRGKENLKWIADDVSELFPDFDTTTTITSGVRDSHVYIHALPKHSFGKDEDKASDPDMKKFFKSAKEHEHVGAQVVFSTRAHLLANSYIDNAVCNYRDQ